MNQRVNTYNINVAFYMKSKEVKSLELEEFKLYQSEKQKLYKRTLELKAEIYRKYPVGGALHIVLDDGNIDNCHIECCINDINELKEDKEIFLECANNLIKMSKRQRYKIYRTIV